MDDAPAPSEELLVQRSAGVLTLTLNRPERRNALTDAMLSQMLDQALRAAEDPEVRAVVVTGAGGAFCAGGDVKSFAAERQAGPPGLDQLETRATHLRHASELSRVLHEMPKPTLAVIPGAAAGAGLSIALACDLRMASEDAKLTTAFAKVGLSGDYGGSYFLTQLVGVAKARELYFLSPVITGRDAERLGIVNWAAPSAELGGAARAFAETLAKLPTVAIGHMKRNLNLAARAGLAEVLDAEAPAMVRTSMTQDHYDASIAFVEKRSASFHGR